MASYSISSNWPETRQLHGPYGPCPHSAGPRPNAATPGENAARGGRTTIPLPFSAAAASASVPGKASEAATDSDQTLDPSPPLPGGLRLVILAGARACGDEGPRFGAP